jgi:hypothetical protein
MGFYSGEGGKPRFRFVGMDCVSALDKLKVEGDEQIGVNIVKRDGNR